MKTTPLKLNFGAWEATIYSQLKKQGVKVASKFTSGWQKITADIVRLNIHGILSDAEANNAHKRLAQRILSEIKKP